EKDLQIIQDLEVKLGIDRRWLLEDLHWEASAVMVGKHRYQCCLDKLKGLVVSRMFELTKMNMS
ncbi:hypothetical protein BYT27DRAFT_7019291, partial [Phlegmacium glaucopus]